MTIPELEFTEQDLAALEEFPWTMSMAEALNRILAEKIAKLPKVGHHCRARRLSGEIFCNHANGKALWCTPKKFDTHEAYLIGMREVKK